jgi:hypothetical protein
LRTKVNIPVDDHVNYEGLIGLTLDTAKGNITQQTSR